MGLEKNKMQMKTAIVMPTVPGNELYVKCCVRSLKEHTRPEDYDLYIIKNDFTGFAKGVNDGIKEAKKKWNEYDSVIILNDDVVVLPQWLEILREQAKTAGIVGQEKREFHVAFYVAYIKKEVIDKIGLLDERFILGEFEDVDYCIRAIDAGYRLSACPRNVVIHKWSHTMDNLSEEKKKKKKKNRKIFLNKWRGTRWERMF
jgi:GT2 family glycosyltransferase